jgi:crotonobetainyl-CoA:carnitine CoA-transferase CaiB-like acyl-CoA transferase
MSDGSRPGPLAGVRVLDLTRVLSGPHCTRMLCDLGADVIKVEPPDGDLTRFAWPRVNSLAGYFVQQNVGKRNVSLDLRHPEAVELLLGLAAHCDVLIENFRPGVAARMGIGYDAVAARNPTIVYASISGYGQTGPWVHRRAYAPVIGAESGVTKIQGDARGGAYANDPLSHADVYTAMETATAIVAALYARERTGAGDHIDVSMAQTMLYVNEHTYDSLWDEPVADSTIRSFGPGDYPVLTAGDGRSVVVSGNLAERGAFELYMAAAGRTDLVEDPRFVDVAARRAHFGELLEIVRSWAASQPDVDQLEAALAANGLAMGVIRSVREVCDTDWAAHRQVVTEVDDRGGGTIRVPNAPWRFASADVGVRGHPRYRGEDNHEVFGELLGLPSDELSRLDESGVFVSRRPG